MCSNNYFLIKKLKYLLHIFINLFLFSIKNAKFSACLDQGVAL